ncbi:MAG TPA: hypothetical protein DCS45_20600 [Roseovarius nubinhibens]|uniref:Uncharacterized protein n=1 Tax=Roseovarius nubinhibens TaxID=314263 RepID=A0A348WI87_9RHOB|nr:hypothetical protein [Roseovarius nubinhibens]
MTTQAYGDDGLGLSTSIRRLEQQLSDMTRDLERIQSKLRDGPPEILGNSGRLISDIRQWLRIAFEAEADLERRKTRDTDTSAATALDLDAARHSIGCRLDRLRRACAAGEVSQQPE